MIIFGNIMLLNLFLAILLNSVSGDSDEEEAQDGTQADDKSMKSERSFSEEKKGIDLNQSEKIGDVFEKAEE